ncbi:unnamed protein product [Cladocopium goreaui]|uniref:Uncharacterized protein n=1 Tax=Cladocopium goreaui TaxID=2562237 RepID=A0A9P1DMQ3_9DINO|nr:unnamed protein product [Cladocopium goreaui]
MILHKIDRKPSTLFWKISVLVATRVSRASRMFADTTIASSTTTRLPFLGQLQRFASSSAVLGAQQGLILVQTAIL